MSELATLIEQIEALEAEYKAGNEDDCARLKECAELLFSPGVKQAVEAAEKLPKQWMIWSNEHGAWWKAHSKGYSVMLADAGHYSFDDAVEICMGANFFNGNRPSFHHNASPPETMVPVPQPLSPSGGEKPNK